MPAPSRPRSCHRERDRYDRGCRSCCRPTKRRRRCSTSARSSGRTWGEPPAGTTRATSSESSSDGGGLSVARAHDKSYFARTRTHFDSVTLAPYDAQIAAIRSSTPHPVGASESIFAMLAQHSPRSGDPAVVPQGHQRGHRRVGGGQRDDRQPDRAPAHQDLRLQQPERDTRRPGSARRGQGRAHSGRDHHRDPQPANSSTRRGRPAVKGSPPLCEGKGERR